jgi:hypothetical protein
MKADDIQQIPADTLLAEELAREDVVEMANLTTAQTGVPGTIFISTAMGGHGPRVKYFLQAGRSQPLFSVFFRHDLRRSEGGGQQSSNPCRSPDVSTSNQLGLN